MTVTLRKGSEVRQTQRRRSKQPANLWRLSTSKRCSKYANIQGRGAECIRTASTSLFPHTKHTLSSHTSQLPPVNCELYRQMSPDVPCAEAAAERKAVCGRGKTTPTIKQGWASQWPTGGQTHTMFSGAGYIFVFLSTCNRKDTSGMHEFPLSLTDRGKRQHTGSEITGVVLKRSLTCLSFRRKHVHVHMTKNWMDAWPLCPLFLFFYTHTLWTCSPKTAH